VMSRPLACGNLVGSFSQGKLSLGREAVRRPATRFGVFGGVLADDPVAEVDRRHVAQGLRRIAGRCLGLAHSYCA